MITRKQGFDEKWAAEYMQRFDKEIKPYHPDTMEADEGPESNLQKKIVAWAKNKGYPCLSFKQSRKAIGYLLPGYPDITLFLPAGRVILLELKSEKGVLRDKQRELGIIFLHLGFTWAVCKSFKQFLNIINNPAT
jgi:hypothetical protein